ncbi:MAG: hypothetical protein KF843_06475 [Flavobacteriales bacterium]|nr:hypothetical protein [Flavobacteriales bacterium]
MIKFIRAHTSLWGLIAIWILVAAKAPILLYAVLPISVFLMRRSGMWQEMLFGFLLCAVLSDMDPDIHQMAVMKTAKYTYIVSLTLIVLMDQVRMRPMARIFGIFLPFFVYAFLPVIASPVPVVAIQKTISYASVFLVIPNLVLFNYRRSGWPFLRNMVWFLVLILVAQQAMPYLGPEWWYTIDGRFRGFFGNPNGMALYCFLVFLLFSVVNYLRPQLFSRMAKLFIYGVLIYYLITCGARTALMSTLMFVLFIQFFRISTFLGIISFVAFIGIGELLASNLPAIITALGLEEYLRVDTIADGSGRYIAWQFAWQTINDQGFFLFGGGFENEAMVFLKAYRMLSALGHQGGVHNTYLAFWLNTGIVGLLLYFRSFALIFIKAGKNTPISFAIMFAVLFSILYESWLAGSLSPYTTLFLVILAIVAEDEIMGSVDREEEEAELLVEEPVPIHEPLILPAR